MQTVQRRLLPSTSALAAFDAVARLSSFSAAAHELSLTQGAVSRQIAGLEEQLGVALFSRGSRGVVLTDPGRTYAATVSHALAIIRDASLEAMTGRHGRTLNLAILPTFGTRWLMPRIRGFVDGHPDITLNFATRIGRFDFEKEGLDAAIHVGQPDWPGAESLFLMQEEVAPVCAPAFARENDISTPAAIARLPLLHLASRPGAWQHWFATTGVKPPVEEGMRFEQFATVAQACLAGVGVALLPLFLIRTELENGTLQMASDRKVQSPSAYYLVAPKTKWKHPPVAAFRDWLSAEMSTWLASEGTVLAW